MKLNKVKVFLCIFVICLIIIGIIFLKQTINNKNPHESSQEKDEIIEKDIIPPKIELNGNWCYNRYMDTFNERVYNYVH